MTSDSWVTRPRVSASSGCWTGIGILSCETSTEGNTTVVGAQHVVVRFGDARRRGRNDPSAHRHERTSLSPEVHALADERAYAAGMRTGYKWFMGMLIAQSLCFVAFMAEASVGYVRCWSTRARGAW